MSYPAPILNLQFANAKQLHPAVAFSRASIGSYFGSTGLLRYARAGVPRLDHDPLTGSCKGLLVEPPATFLDTYSEQLDNAAWAKAYVTVNGDAIKAPDGQNTADKVVVDSSASVHRIMRSISATVGIHTVSVYAEAGDLHVVSLELWNGSTAVYATVNLNTGEFVVPSDLGPNNSTAKIEKLPNGQYKISVSHTLAATGNGISIYILNDSYTANYTGDGTSGLYIWGVKIYAGTDPTSYLPTTTAGVARAADICSVDLAKLIDTNGNPLWTGTEGTIVVDAIAPPTTDESFVMMIGDADNRVSIDRTAGGVIDFYAYGNSTVTGLIHGPTVGASNRFRFCYGFANGVAKLSVNGGNVLSATGLVVPSPLSTLWIGSLVGVLTWGGTFRSVQVYNRLISDARFPALSAL